MMLVFARGQNHDAWLVALLACLVLVRLVKKPVRYIPTVNTIKHNWNPTWKMFFEKSKD